MLCGRSYQRFARGQNSHGLGHGRWRCDDVMCLRMFSHDLVGWTKAAYAAVHIRLLRLKYAGGCPRNFAGCPKGWVKTDACLLFMFPRLSVQVFSGLLFWQGAMCAPKDTYDGICGTFAADAPDSVKEDLSWKCQASWPCLSPCSKDLFGCPAGWKKSGGLCAAPADYDGICSPAMDFRTFSDEQKYLWSAQCGAPW
jgi:CPW-WPC domain-containing protein